MFHHTPRPKTILVILLLYSLTTAITFALTRPETQDRDPEVKAAIDTPIPTPTLPPPPSDQDPINIVLVGHGGAGHQGGNLADSIMLLHLDPTNQKKALISVPRDLWILLQDGPSSQNHYKINSAFALSLDDLNADIDEAVTSLDPGNKNLIKSAITTVTDLPAHFVMAIDFIEFVKAIDTLGPLTVDVPHAINDQYYPVRGRELELCGFTPEETTQMTATMSGFNLEKQFKCRYEAVVYDKGITTMTGEDALKFSRSRHSSINGGDFNRSIRQQAVIKAIQDKLSSLSAFQNAGEFFQKLNQSVTTDINTNQAIQIASAIVSLRDVELKEIYLNTQNVFQNSKASSGAFIVIPKSGLDTWADTHTYIQSQLQ